MNGPFIQHVISAAEKSEQALASEAFEEFKRLTLKNVDDTVELGQMLSAFALLAVALGWVEKPRVYTRVMTDGVQLRDSVG